MLAGAAFLHLFVPTLVSKKKAQKEIGALCRSKLQQDMSVAAENCKCTCIELMFKHWNQFSDLFSEWCLHEKCFDMQADSGCVK